jgi:hypothetical protein
MITEDYVSFEVAKLLEEKGFEILTNKVYDNQNKLDYQNVVCWQEKRLPYVSAPTLQMAMKWLREVYNIVISIFPTIETDVIVREDYNYTIYKNRTAIYQNSSLTYEQSCEESIKYTLKNLI